MKHPLYPLALLALLAACDGSQPIIFDEGPEEVPTDGEPETIEEILEESTEEQELSSFREDRGDIFRTELLDLETGAGFAEDFTLDATEDSLTIDNLAFDGLNIYTRGENLATPKLSSIGDIAVYHGDETVPDFLTGTEVPQLVPHIALYGESDVIIEGDEDEGVADLPRTSFALVRTAGYLDILPGPGGFVFQRAGDSVIAETGQATFQGDYAGLRIFNKEFDVTGARPVMEVTSGDARIDIDFDDFNDLEGVKGSITNRRSFDEFGNELPVTNLIDRFSAPTTGLPAGVTQSDLIQLPDLRFNIRIDGTAVASDGEISGKLSSSYVEPTTGDIVVYEEGDYFAIIAGDTTVEDGGEIVGVIVIEAAEDSRPALEGVTVQETGGFIATR